MDADEREQPQIAGRGSALMFWRRRVPEPEPLMGHRWRENSIGTADERG